MASAGVRHAGIGVIASILTAMSPARPDRVERRHQNFADARIRLVDGVAVEAVELGLAFAEIDVDTGFGKAVWRAMVLLNCEESDGYFRRQFLDGVAARRITAVDEFFRIAVAG